MATISVKPAATETINANTPTPSIAQLRNAIPEKCFQRSATTSTLYIIRDCICVAALFVVASFIPHIDNTALRIACWSAYGFIQGCFFTGIWILAHECGHQALFNNNLVNDSFGFVLHSFLLVPYYSWKYSHALHHRYHNHMEKDTAFVPARQDDVRPLRIVQQLLHAGEDTPILSLLFLVGHQLIGWPVYLIFNITAGKGSEASSPKSWASKSHFDPRASIFTDSQRISILLSDLGLLTMLAVLWRWSQLTSIGNVMLTYGIPYLWVNHWLVAITFLHHTHESSMHYEAEAWNFRDGALSTVDRDFGFIGREIMHGIIEFHVIHHFFTKIPFYHAEEATEAIKPLLGEKYLVDETPIWIALWRTFNNLSYVKPQIDNPNILIWDTTTAHDRP